MALSWVGSCDLAPSTSLSITNSQSLPKLMSIESVMPSNHLILYHPLPLLPSIFPSIRVFSNESALRMRWPKYWSFRFNIRPCSEYPGLISFRMDWLDLLAVIKRTQIEIIEKSNSTYITKLGQPTFRLKQCWKSLVNSNLESQLGKGPGLYVHPMGETSNC